MNLNVKWTFVKGFSCLKGVFKEAWIHFVFTEKNIINKIIFLKIKSISTISSIGYIKVIFIIISGYIFYNSDYNYAYCKIDHHL